MLYTDIFNAKRFYKMFKDRVRYCSDAGGWYVFDGKKWRKDNGKFVKNFAVQWHESLQKEIRDTKWEDEDQLELFSKHVKASGSNAKLEAMLDLSKSFFHIESSDFDNKGFYINCQNGTYDLKNGRYKEHDPSDYLTKISESDFIKGYKCPHWIKYLDDIFLGRQELVDFIQRAVGYALTASTEEQCMFILYGHGRNGKTVFIETISKILGTYARSSPSSTFVKKKNMSVPNDVASLKGARFVSAIETSENVTLDESLIKQLTGGDKVTARFLYGEFFEFHPTFKIFMATNHKPNIRGTDTGIWRRIRMIPFDLKLTEETMDGKIPGRLEKELPGILNWAIQGYMRWQRDGLCTPQSVKDATMEYREEEDDLGQFISDYIIEDKNGFVPVNQFKQRFKDVNGYPKSQKSIAEYMKRIGVPSGRPTFNGSQVRSWMGIRFVNGFDKNQYVDESGW